MKSKNLQLVPPKASQDTYSKDQRDWLMNVSGFTEHVLDKQKDRIKPSTDEDKSYEASLYNLPNF